MVLEFISSIYNTQDSSNIQNFKPAQMQLQISIAKGLHDMQYQIAAINTLIAKIAALSNFMILHRNRSKN